jgi:adenylate kinase
MIAAPGGGKGTQGERLSAKFGIQHVSSGDLLRAAARADDSAEVIRHRLRVFAEATSPLIDYYRGRGILVEVDGNQPADAITADIVARLPSAQ